MVIGVKARIEEPLVEPVGFIGRLERVGVLGDSGNAEGVGHAADRDDQRVVRNSAAGKHLGAPLVRCRTDRDLAATPVEPLERPATEVEVVPACLREVVDLVCVDVHAPGCDFVQQRLPQVRLVPVHERHRGAPPAPEAVSGACDKLEASGAPADHDNAVRASHRLSDIIFDAELCTTRPLVIGGASRPLPPVRCILAL